MLVDNCEKLLLFFFTKLGEFLYRLDLRDNTDGVLDA